MDKCREEFEKWLDDNNMFMNIERRFDQESNTYDYCAIRWIWESWQHQQAKVEELKASHHGEVIGHEVHFKKIKQERDELQKRVDAAIKCADLNFWNANTVKAMVEALKGECKHESDGSFLLSDPPRTKCKKCGEFYFQSAQG